MNEGLPTREAFVRFRKNFELSSAWGCMELMTHGAVDRYRFFKTKQLSRVRLNPSESTIEKQESGAEKPGRMALNLLDVVRRHGLKILA